MKEYPISFLVRMTEKQKRKLMRIAQKNKVSEAGVVRNFIDNDS